MGRKEEAIKVSYKIYENLSFAIFSNSGTLFTPILACLKRNGSVQVEVATNNSPSHLGFDDHL